MPSQNQRTYLFLVWVCALLLLGVFATAFLVYRYDGDTLFDFFALVLFLPISYLIYMAFSYRRSWSADKLSHVSALMEVEHQLDKTARRYKSLLEGAGTPIFVFNADTGLLVEVNRRGTELLGYGRDEMASLRGKDLLPEEEHEKFTSLVHRVIRRGRGRAADGITFRRRGGECFLGEVDARLIDLGDERLVHVTVRDITHKHRAEREIRQRNRELSTLIGIISRANREMELETVLDVTLRETIEVFGAGGGGIHLREQEGGFRPAALCNVSDGLAAALGGHGKEGGVLGRIASTRAPAAFDDLAAVDPSSLAAGAPAGWKGFAGVPLLARNRVTGVMYLLDAEARRFDDNEMKLFLSIADQVGIVIEHARLFDELKWKSDELMSSFRLLEKSSHELALSQHQLRTSLTLVERANQELERVDRMKSSFLGMISHEFRTPLTSILSGAEFLISAHAFEHDADARRILDMIRQGGERLSEIVSDVLKVARLEARGTAMLKTPLHISQVLGQVLDRISPRVEERGLRIVFSNLDGLPYCNGDRECLEDIFSELLENSVKFTPDGGTIMITARVVDQRSLVLKKDLLARFSPAFFGQMGERCYLEVEVRDNGIGVNGDEQVKIFEKFYEIGEIRHHSSGKHKFQGKGAGLGLAIVKGMVEAHGGMVWVESLGSDPHARFGSAFYVLLPLEDPPQRESAIFHCKGGGVEGPEGMAGEEQ